MQHSCECTTPLVDVVVVVVAVFLSIIFLLLVF